MRVVVVGASGNVGTAVLRRLAREASVDTVTGVARRLPPRGAFADVDWRSIDVGAPDGIDLLSGCFAGADAVIQLAWQIQPSHDQARLRRTNVTGTAQVAAAAVRAGVPALVVASSVGVYAPGPKDREVDEDWPTTGVPGSTYSRDKVDVEALLDEVERVNPELRLVRLRPGLVFQRSAASEIARLFIGPLAPLSLLGFGRLPLVPAVRGLRVQAVHADDVADAYVRAALSATAAGPFNIAARPVLDAASVAARFHGRQVPVPARLLPAAAAATWRARLQPVEPGWVDLALRCPLLSSDRAGKELGWQPRVDAMDALAELFQGMADRAGDLTHPLRSRPGATARLAALAGGRLPGHGDPY
jgi:nucleoside-diphosphate-sugar epimerase